MARNSIHDVAAYVYEQLGDDIITQMKLYKLLWFCKGWHYAVKDRALFPEKFAAWKYGPIPMDLFCIYRDNVDLQEWNFRGDSYRIKGKARKLVDKVLKHYGSLSEEHLLVLSRRCRPWQDNYDDGIPFQRISDREIREYFRGLVK